MSTTRLFVITFVWVLLAFAPPTAFAQSGEAAGVPVRLDGKELFRLHHGVDQLSVEERAALIESRLYDLALNPFRPSGKFEVRQLEGRSDVMFGDRFVMAVTDDDAVSEGTSRPDLASQRLDLIRAEVELQRATYWRPQSLAIGLAATAVVTVVLWLIVGFVRRWLAAKVAEFARDDVAVAESEASATQGAMSRVPVRHAMARLISVVRTVVLLVAVGLYFLVIMSFFPRTRFVASSLLESLYGVLATVWNAMAGYAPNLMFLAVIVVITYVVIRTVRFFFAEVSQGSLTFPGFETEWAEPTYKIAVFLILALAAVMAYPYLPGSQSQAFQAVSLFLGLLISLSSSSAISNIIAGVILTYTGAFRMGDRVRIAEAMGDIVGKTLLVTRVRTNKNVDIAIPNALVLSSHIVNYSRVAKTDGVIMHTAVTIGYDAPWRQVHDLLITAAKNTIEIIEDPPPFVLQTSLNDFYVTYELNAYTRNPWRMQAIYSSMHQNIQDQFNEAGVEIMSPHFAGVRDGNAMAIPEKYLPENYEAPGFRVLPK